MDCITIQMSFPHIYGKVNTMPTDDLQLTPPPHPPNAAYLYASVNWVSIGSNNSLSPIRRQAVILTDAWLLSIGP